MQLVINIEKKHFLILVALISLLGIFIIGTAEDVKPDLPYHYLQQVAVNSNDMTSVDENEDGVIDQAEDSDTVDNQHWSDIQTWVNSNDDYEADDYIGDYEYQGHDAGSDLNMGYYDLCLNGDCRNSWPTPNADTDTNYVCYELDDGTHCTEYLGSHDFCSLRGFSSWGAGNDYTRGALMCYVYKSGGSWYLEMSTNSGSGNWCRAACFDLN